MNTKFERKTITDKKISFNINKTIHIIIIYSVWFCINHTYKLNTNKNMSLGVTFYIIIKYVIAHLTEVHNSIKQKCDLKNNSRKKTKTYKEL